MNLWRRICISLDSIVYGAVETIFQLIMDLADLEIFTESVINEFSSRIYIILGLIMLFKIIFSFIQILIDPDKMGDKEKGAVGVLKRVVIALVLIVMVPSIFDLARQVQSQVIPIIPKVILGSEADLDDSETMASVGRNMAFHSFLPFFYYDNASCNSGEILGTGTEETEGNAKIWSVQTAATFVNETCPTSNHESGYKYNYRWLLSTAVGVYLVYVLVFMAISIAVRAIKLAICEFVAPISIASYVDPKTSKQAFDNWVSTSTKTYLDLFIRLIVIYFVIFVFMTVFKTENLAVIYSKLGGDVSRGIFVTLFIILALLKFAKDAPKFISEMLGIKGGGDIMGMFKGAGSLFASSVGAGIGGLGNTINGLRQIGSGDSFGTIAKKVGQAALSGLAGTSSGIWNGGRAALTGKGAKAAFSASTQNVWKKRNLRIADKAGGATLGGRLRTSVKDYFQFNDDVSLAEGTLKSLNTLHSGMGSHKQSVFKQIDKDDEVGFYGAHNGTSKTIQSLGKLLSEHISTINEQGNADLRNLVSGKFEYDENSNSWKLASGASFGYADLKALEAAATQSGIGSLAARLSENGAIRLGAQKEIYEAANLGHAETRSGVSYDEFLENPDFANPRQDMETNLRRNAGDFIGMYVEGFGEIKKAEDVMTAFNKNPKKFDDAVQGRMRNIQSQVAENSDSVNRAANQRWKDSNRP